MEREHLILDNPHLRLALGAASVGNAIWMGVENTDGSVIFAGWMVGLGLIGSALHSYAQHDAPEVSKNSSSAVNLSSE